MCSLCGEQNISLSIALVNDCSAESCDHPLDWRFSVGMHAYVRYLSVVYLFLLSDTLHVDKISTNNLFVHSYKPKHFCCICGGGYGNGGMYAAAVALYLTCLSLRNISLSCLYFSQACLRGIIAIVT